MITSWEVTAARVWVACAMGMAWASELTAEHCEYVQSRLVKLTVRFT